jgi:hypothetical protein
MEEERKKLGNPAGREAALNRVMMAITYVELRRVMRPISIQTVFFGGLFI